MRTLPHDDYIEAVTEALTAAGITTADIRTDDCETRGTYCYLNAVIELDLFHTSHAGAWPHGLILVWEWHTGVEDGEPERGPQWLFAELKDDGSNAYPSSLPAYGYASPAAIVEATRKVISREIKPNPYSMFGEVLWDGGVIGDSWERHTELDTACEAWGTDEAKE